MKKGTEYDPKITGLICKAWWRWCHGVGMHTVSGTDPLNFTDDLMYDDSSRMNLVGYRTILSTNSQENTTRFIGKCFILHQDNDPKHPASSVKDFIRAKKWKVLDCPNQSPDLNLIEHEFHQLKRRVKAETVGIGCIKGWESISKDETKSLVMSMGHRLTAVIVCKRSATK